MAKSPISPFTAFSYTIQDKGIVEDGKSSSVYGSRSQLSGKELTGNGGSLESVRNNRTVSWISQYSTTGLTKTIILSER